MEQMADEGVPTSVSHDGGPGLAKAHEALRGLRSEGKPRRENSCREGKGLRLLYTAEDPETYKIVY